MRSGGPIGLFRSASASQRRLPVSPVGHDLRDELPQLTAAYDKWAEKADPAVPSRTICEPSRVDNPHAAPEGERDRSTGCAPVQDVVMDAGGSVVGGSRCPQTEVRAR